MPRRGSQPEVGLRSRLYRTVGRIRSQEGAEWSQTSRELGNPQLTLQLAGLSGSCIYFSESAPFSQVSPWTVLFCFFFFMVSHCSPKPKFLPFPCWELTYLALTPMELVSSVQYCLTRISGFRLERERKKEERDRQVG